jgi:endonuclease/exonuclease/phosphatase family metal-dependent hydrolase
MRIVAYNFLRAGSLKRSGHWSRVIRHLNADLVLAQECRPPQDSPGERFRHGEGDVLVWQSAGSRGWGSGLFARSASLVPIKIPDYEGWVVGGEIRNASWSRRPVIVFSIHGPVGDHGYIRTMQHILDRITVFRGRADLVLGGDFNVAVGYRHTRERIRFVRGERDILDRLAGEFDMVSCWQAANPGRPLAQTLRWMGNPSAPYHCDGIFAPRSWLSRLQSCRIVRGSRWARLSDHNPVIAEFYSPPETGGVAAALRKSGEADPSAADGVVAFEST